MSSAQHEFVHILKASQQSGSAITGRDLWSLGNVEIGADQDQPAPG
jgi:hypothetical protein